MSVSFTYRVVRYVHDPAAGETLNIGVILYAPDAGYLDARMDTRYERLSRTFARFEGEQYRTILRRFNLSVERFRERELQPLLFSAPAKTVSDLTRQIWPDEDLSFRMGPVLAGVTEYPEEELVAIFERMVLSQYLHDERQRRTDEEVWSLYKKPLAERAVVSVLKPKTIATADFHLTFEHAFKNERWHALQPLSLDYANSESIQRKAAQWLGNGTALMGQNELSTVYLLLGKPQLESHRPAYEKAKNLLHKMPLNHDIIEEDSAQDFASHIEKYIRVHEIGTLKKSPEEV
jgi:hypothetical protein